MSAENKNRVDVTTASINMNKRIPLFISIFIAIASLALFFVCLGGANDSSEANYASEANDAKDINNEVKIQSLPSLYFEEEDEKNQTNEEEEVKNSTPGKATHVFFLWRYTSAAVCFSVLALIPIPVLLILYEENNGWEEKKICFVWLLLLAVPLAIVPAVRMDGFCTGTYWLFFIPHLLLALALPIVLVVLWCPCRRVEADCIIVIASLVVSYLLFLAGLILWIIRLNSSFDSVPPFKYAFVLLFFALAFAVGFGGLAVGSSSALGSSWGKSLRPSDGPFILAVFAASFFLTSILFGGFLLPFTLRKDHVFGTSYHYTLIPEYVLVFVLAIVLICLSKGIKFENKNK